MVKVEVGTAREVVHTYEVRHWTTGLTPRARLRHRQPRYGRKRRLRPIGQAVF